MSIRSMFAVAMFFCITFITSGCNEQKKKSGTTESGTPAANASTANSGSSAETSTPLPGEPWSGDWQILVNTKDKPDLPPNQHPHGWFNGELEPHFGNRPPFEGTGKHPGLLILHPVSGREPAKISFKGSVPADRPVLLVDAAGSVHGDFVLRCVANGKTIKDVTLDGKKWSTCDFDLSEYAGKPVEIELWNVPGGSREWYFETCFIDQIKFGPPQANAAVASSSPPAANASPAPGPLVFENLLFSPNTLDSLYKSFGQYGGRAFVEAGTGLRLGRGHTNPMVWAKPYLGDRYRVQFDVQLKSPGWASWTLNGPGYGNSIDAGYTCFLENTRVSFRRDGVEVQSIDLPNSPADTWAAVQAEVNGNKIAVTLNGILIVQFTDPSPLSGALNGWFGLSAGESAFRNLRIWSAEGNTNRERQLTPLPTQKPAANGELLHELKIAGSDIGADWWKSQPDFAKATNNAVELTGPNGTPAIILTKPLKPDIALEVEFEYPTDEAVNLSLMLWHAQNAPQTAKDCAGGWKVDLPIGNGKTTVFWHRGPQDAPEKNFETRGPIVASTAYYAPISKRKYVARVETHGDQLRVFLDGGLVLTAKRPADAAAPDSPVFAGLRQFYGGSKVYAVRVFQIAP